MSLRIMQPVPEDFWWNVARQCEYATFYHTPLWRDIALHSFPVQYQDATFGGILANRTRVVFPIIATRTIGPFRWLHSTFENCYGGFIADGPVNDDEAAELYQHACRISTYTLYTIDNPFDAPLPEPVQSMLQEVYTEPTYLVHLDADFDAIMARFSRARRTAYRRGLKKGVEVRQMRSLDEMVIYYGSYRDAIERWGEATGYGYPWHMFEQIYYLSQAYPEQIKIWIMIVNKQIAGGRMIFYWNKVASLWHGASHRDFLEYDVMPVGDTEIIRDALDHGYRYFDFNTSGNKEGVMTYKERFGTETRPVTMWRFANPLLQPVQQIYWKVTGKR